MTWFQEAIKSAGHAIGSHLMRSMLTTLGIVIGVASVIVMIAVGEGARTDIERRIASLGTNVLQLRPGSSRVSGRSVGADTRLPFSERDVASLRSSVAGIVAVSGYLRRSATAIHKDVNWLTNVDGVHPTYPDIRDWPLVNGRFFSDDEYQSAARVAVVGATVMRSLGETQSITGQRIRIGDTPFDVIGLLDTKGADPAGKDQDDVILVPLSTLRARMLKRHKLVADQVGTVSVKVDQDAEMDEVREKVTSLLRSARGSSRQAGDTFEIRDLTEFLRARTATQQTLSLLLAAAAAISLIVGGIGIMNIMLVSVTERTREIGLRLAVGARRSDIRVQFLSEAIMLCLIGGALGCAIGVAAAAWIASIGTWPVLIAPSVFVLALGAATLTGICFGFLPAQRASRLNPIEALRSE